MSVADERQQLWSSSETMTARALFSTIKAAKPASGSLIKTRAPGQLSLAKAHFYGSDAGGIIAREDGSRVGEEDEGCGDNGGETQHDVKAVIPRAVKRSSREGFL